MCCAHYASNVFKRSSVKCYVWPINIYMVSHEKYDKNFKYNFLNVFQQMLNWDKKNTNKYFSRRNAIVYLYSDIENKYIIYLLSIFFGYAHDYDRNENDMISEFSHSRQMVFMFLIQMSCLVAVFNIFNWFHFCVYLLPESWTCKILIAKVTYLVTLVVLWLVVLHILGGVQVLFLCHENSYFHEQ